MSTNWKTRHALYLSKVIDRCLGRYITSTMCLLKIKYRVSNFLELQMYTFFFCKKQKNKQPRPPKYYWTSSTFCIQITCWDLFPIYCQDLSAIANHNKYQIMIKQKSDLRFVCSISGWWKCVQNQYASLWNWPILMAKPSLKYFHLYAIYGVTNATLCKTYGHLNMIVSDNESTCIVH